MTYSTYIQTRKNMKKNQIINQVLFFILLLIVIGCKPIKITNNSIIKTKSNILNIDFYQTESLMHLKSIKVKNCKLNEINIIIDTSNCIEINNFCPPMIFLGNQSGYIYSKIKLENGNYFLLIKNKKENHYKISRIYKEKSVKKHSIKLR